jgi:hypothetical protein
MGRGVNIFGPDKKVARPHRTRCCAEPAIIAEAACADQGEVVRQGAYIVDLHRPGGVEIAEVGEIRALAVL